MGGSAGFVIPTLDIIHLVTKPVVEPDFLQDWLAFLCKDQGFSVHLLYSDDAFGDDSNKTLAERFPYTRLHRIEKLSRYGAKDQALVLLADYLDLRYLSRALNPSLVHSHDTRSLLLSRFLFPDAVRLHSWWLEDRSAHRLWRVTVERLADFRTWETTSRGVDQASQAHGALAALNTRQIPLPTPVTLSEHYERGEAFDTIRELYRTILRDTDLRARV